MYMNALFEESPGVETRCGSSKAFLSLYIQASTSLIVRLREYLTNNRDSAEFGREPGRLSFSMPVLFILFPR